jgi:thiosulfate/3-mercaptopyruvate sulfurtransferase
VTILNPLIHVAALATRLAGSDRPTLIDVRWWLNGPSGRDAYREGHIPGAVFVDLDADLCGPPGVAGRHPLPQPERLQRALRAAGVREGHPVVVYDSDQGYAAARLWWTLRWAGHDLVQMLDGGYAAWTAEGRPVEPGEVTPGTGDITVRPGSLPVLDAAGAARLARTGVLLDVRAAPRYRGETEPIDPVAGHVPGAVNLPESELVDADQRLLPAERLRARFAAARVRPGVPVGAYCGSGLTAAHAVLALTVAGVPDPALYVGSWSDWINDPARPVATGPDEAGDHAGANRPTGPGGAGEAGGDVADGSNGDARGRVGHGRQA